MEVKKNVNAGKEAAPISNHNHKSASRLKVKTNVKAGQSARHLPIITIHCQPPE